MTRSDVLIEGFCAIADRRGVERRRARGRRLIAVAGPEFRDQPALPLSGPVCVHRHGHTV